MDGPTLPGEDLFVALQSELCDAAIAHTNLAVEALMDRAWTWGKLPAHVKAVFSAAAIRFLSE